MIIVMGAGRIGQAIMSAIADGRLDGVQLIQEQAAASFTEELPPVLPRVIAMR